MLNTLVTAEENLKNQPCAGGWGEGLRPGAGPGPKGPLFSSTTNTMPWTGHQKAP